MSYQIKIPSCIFGGAGSIENVKAVIEKENAKIVIIFVNLIFLTPYLPIMVTWR